MNARRLAARARPEHKVPLIATRASHWCGLARARAEKDLLRARGTGIFVAPYAVLALPANPRSAHEPEFAVARAVLGEPSRGGQLCFDVQVNSRL